jgi:ribose-phosphate pyrophosphokinase
VVAPDTGRVKLAETWAKLLGGQPIAFIQHRKSLHAEHPDTAQLVGDVAHRLCVVVDDMIDTGTTMVGAVRLLHAAGAAGVIAAATHGVLSGDATERLSSSGIREVVLTDTLPISDDKHFTQLSLQSIAPLVARAIDEIFTDGSITSLFDDRP